MLLDSTAVDHVVSRILLQLREHQNSLPPRPFVIGLTGLQGSGKSTWANALAQELEQKHKLKVVNVSLDDFYHDHENLRRVRDTHKDNPLFRTRGQPGTHDEQLAAHFFDTLSSGTNVRVPAFDKSKFDGEGDRVPQDEWKVISGDPPIDVVIFEGWCVGFTASTSDQVRAKWQRSKDAPRADLMPGASAFPTDTIGTLKLEDLLAVNSSLAVYNQSFMGRDWFDYFVHLDTEDLENVYKWRLDQEHALWKTKGSGMTDEEVVAFVRGYMPGYELYLDKLREDGFGKRALGGGYLKLILDKERNVTGYKML